MVGSENGLPVCSGHAVPRKANICRLPFRAGGDCPLQCTVDSDGHPALLMRFFLRMLLSLGLLRLRTGSRYWRLDLRVLGQILEFLAGLEDDHRARGQPYGLVGPWVAGDTAGTSADLKHPEVSQLDAAFLCQRADYSVQNALDDLASYSLVNAIALRQVLDDLLFRHSFTPICRAGRRVPCMINRTRNKPCG
jgi:hypothetical protein